MRIAARGVDTASDTAGGDESGVDQDDWALVAAAQDGDRAAFSTLYRRHVRIVFGFLLTRAGNRSVAEDLTSETFLRALRGIDSVSYRGREIGGWFITIARNLLLDHVRSGRHRLERLTADIGGVGTTAQPGPEDELVAAATHCELMRCVAELSPNHRECIRLRFMAGLSVADTATAMNRTPGAVKAMQYRAIQELARRVPAGLQ